ncbi:hypothetical protein L596_026147 [Steinernema carpocapsae]|uniref:Laminin N-terminal domain-containing protein n=1 Tax=Steinernema carpocapsae TaxID=34508 RepID=A0A4U5M0I8_STECR|nr:hypothetical protein L596_026147 [Steinernema carpocapsae]
MDKSTMSWLLLLLVGFVSAQDRCVDANGDLLPSAALCENEFQDADCEEGFRIPLTVKPVSRDSKYNLELFRRY